MKLNDPEKKWLEDYSSELSRRFPGQIERLFIYGSKARGDSNRESDLDVLLVVQDAASASIPAMRWAGYLLAAEGETVPSIMAYTKQAWEDRAQEESPFWRAVNKDAVRVI